MPSDRQNTRSNRRTPFKGGTRTLRSLAVQYWVTMSKVKRPNGSQRATLRRVDLFVNPHRQGIGSGEARVHGDHCRASKRARGGGKHIPRDALTTQQHRTCEQRERGKSRNPPGRRPRIGHSRILWNDGLLGLELRRPQS